MAKQSLAEMKLGLATVIPWSLVLILGTMHLPNVSRTLFGPQAFDSQVDNEEGGGEGEDTTVADLLNNVRTEFVKIESPEDKILIYKLFSGSAEYLKNSVSLKDTSQFDPILSRVQTSYGWNRESYPDFTQAVSDYLIAVGYDEPRKLDTKEAREWFQDIFETLAGAVNG